MQGEIGLGQLAGNYDVILSDVWGVLHNGIAAWPEAVDALRRFRAGGGTVVLITNSPRPSAPLVGLLDSVGVARDCYDALVSSGDATRAMLRAYQGRKVHEVGPEDERHLYDGLGLIFSSADEAEAVVVTDLDDITHTPEMYLGRAKLWRARHLPLIVANPDRVVEHGDQLVYCGGALADLYAELGGEVRMAGKPFAPIYEEALRLARAAHKGEIGQGRILAIGDSVRTDATGAANQKLDFLFITGSIHAGELEDAEKGAVEKLVAPSGARLVSHLPRLVW